MSAPRWTVWIGMTIGSALYQGVWPRPHQKPLVEIITASFWIGAGLASHWAFNRRWRLS